MLEKSHDLWNFQDEIVHYLQTIKDENEKILDSKYDT